MARINYTMDKVGLVRPVWVVNVWVRTGFRTHHTVDRFTSEASALAFVASLGSE